MRVKFDGDTWPIRQVKDFRLVKATDFSGHMVLPTLGTISSKVWTGRLSRSYSRSPFEISKFREK
jgi:hypothetical protein